MARQLQKLKTLAVTALTKPGKPGKPGRYGDGGGLYLDIDKAGRCRWIFIMIRNGKRREMGLGGAAGASGISLAQARAKAAEARKLVAAGIDPIEARRETEKIVVEKLTFGDCADALIEAKAPGWRSPKHKEQWSATLNAYAKALLTLPIDQVDTASVLGVLKPIWHAKQETASRVRGRIESILDFAKAHGHRTGENPARWRGHLDHLLPKRLRVDKKHHAALPFDAVPDFIARLRQLQDRSVAALALEFTILTAARSGEALGARWAELDLEQKVWTVPAARMKAGREHRVPLSEGAIKIIERLGEIKISEFIFPGLKPGKSLSNMAMEMVMRRLNVDVTIHGFRSAFRDWAGDRTSFPREIAEAALAHAIGNRVEEAYRRSDALEKRRGLMEAWANYCEPGSPSNVVQLETAR